VFIVFFQFLSQLLMAGKQFTQRAELFEGRAHRPQPLLAFFLEDLLAPIEGLE
jgi:hypothetical protein